MLPRRGARGVLASLALLLLLCAPACLRTAFAAENLSAAGPLPPPSPAPFYWLTASQPGLAGSGAQLQPQPQPQPPYPDLSVQWIERTPRYHRYCLQYNDGVPELCPGTEDDQRFPLPGEIVTLTAHIANQGVVASPAVSASWTIEGQNALEPGAGDAVLRSAAVPPLEPCMTHTLAITWPWSIEPATMTLELDPGGTLAETTRSNNRRSHLTSALYLDVAVHPFVANAFAERPNLAGSWSFSDWMQTQVDAMNVDLAGSTYASAPHGAVDRVRIDRLQVTDLLGGGQVTSTLDFDGRWTFRVEPDDPDTPEDEALLSAEAYADAFAGRVDWGLVHELTHQLGAIDLYQLNVAGSYQNELVDADNRPLLLGFQWPNPDLMGGGDRGEHPWYRYSEHTALALNQNSGLRRGYFGEYLFDVPPRNSVLVLDNRGQPLPGARVAFYQTAGGTLRASAVFTGTTDAAGRFALPMRPVPYGGLTTATGHNLAPNPFGAIDVVGFNGQLLAQISQGDQIFYTWWPLTDFNLSAWHGAGSYERVIATHLPPAGLAVPPAPGALRGRVDGMTVTLGWPASPGAAGYRIYRGLEPDFYPFALVAATTALTFTETLPGTARYAVTSVDLRGRESGFGPVFRAQRLMHPVDLVVDPATGQRTVLDRHDGALVTQLADDRWVGRQGSVHLGLTGGEALARNDTGDLLAAVAGAGRLVILNQQRETINWLGQEGFVTGTLALPAGIVEAGKPLAVAVKPDADDSTLALAAFDQDLRLSGAPPLVAQGVTLVPGRFGGAVQVDGEDRLAYDAIGRLDPARGSVQLWVRPDWTWDDGQEHAIVEVGSLPSPATQPHLELASSSRSGTFRLRLAKADWNGLYAWLTDATHDIALFADIDGWQPGQWHHLALVWQAVQPGTDHHRYTLWVDGVLADSRVLRRPVDGAFDRLCLGNGLDGADQADAALDELQISDVARLGNSQQTRLIVSQNAASRLDVLDWLGNPLATLGEPGNGPGQFNAPRGLARHGDRVFVADSGNARVQVLAFDGLHLAPLATWTDGLVAPRSLAALDDGRLLVSDDGDHQVKLLAADGRLLRRWSGPNDGHPGSFWQPAGLALLPGGDALVADAGNGRIVRLIGAGAQPRRYLPLITAR